MSLERTYLGRGHKVSPELLMSTRDLFLRNLFLESRKAMPLPPQVWRRVARLALRATIARTQAPHTGREHCVLPDTSAPRDLLPRPHVQLVSTTPLPGHLRRMTVSVSGRGNGVAVKRRCRGRRGKRLSSSRVESNFPRSCRNHQQREIAGPLCCRRP